MSTSALVLVLAKATVVLLAALAASRLLQRATAGARHVVWLAALGGVVLVPALDAWGPVRVPVLPAAFGLTPGARADAEARPAAALAPSIAGPRVSDASEALGVATAPPEASPRVVAGGTAGAAPGVASDAPPGDGLATAFGVRLPDLATAALALWAVVALGVGASLARSWLAVRRIVRRAVPLSSPDWQDPLLEIADRLDLAEPPRLLRSEAAKMPFACGLARPTVVLPAECDGWAADRRRAVLLHELAHVRRRDLAGHTLGRLVCAAYWFHPLAWTAARRLRAESERACDDLALRCGARPADYAEHLLDIVTAVRRDVTPSVALAMARRGEFEGRMLDILDPERPRGAPSRAQRLALVGALAAVTVVVGAAAPAPVAPPAAAVASQDTVRETAGRRGRASAERPEATERPERAEAEEQAEASGLEMRPDPRPRVDARARGDRVGREIAVRVDDAVAGVAGASAAAVAETATRVALDAVVNVGDEAALRARVRRATREAMRSVTPRDDRRVETLARVLRADTSASIRRTAAWGLAEHADAPVAAAALAAALRADRSAAVREMAAWALSQGDWSSAARDAFAAALRADPDARVRATAAWAAGELGDREAVPALVPALGDASAEVRARAVWAIGTIEPREAPRALLARLGDAEPRVRRLAAWALYSIEDASAIPALEAALRAERDPRLQADYVRALAAIGEPSVDALNALLASSDARVRDAAVRALAGGAAASPWPWPWPEPRPFP